MAVPVALIRQRTPAKLLVHQLSVRKKIFEKGVKGRNSIANTKDKILEVKPTTFKFIKGQ